MHQDKLVLQVKADYKVIPGFLGQQEALDLQVQLVLRATKDFREAQEELELLV